MRLALLIVLLYGCASEPYWVKTHEPVPVKGIVYVDRPCGMIEVDGCASRSTGMIFLRRGMTQTQAWCTENHERKHLAGYSHRADYKPLAKDCGNGEKL